MNMRVFSTFCCHGNLDDALDNEHLLVSICVCRRRLVCRFEACNVLSNALALENSEKSEFALVH